jgi:acetolactate synthase I/II/III large subunit
MNNKMRVADYIAQRCVEAGARHVFLVTGGGAMHLNDAFGRNKSLTPVCFHHEQAAAMAAESYFRVSNKLAVLNVTTGPGGINALNGVYGAYVDSLGMLVISGQVKDETYLKNYPIPLRQLGDQEVDIVSMAKPVVKYATTLHNAKHIRKIMDYAVFLATNGRPGPVWVDVPVDVSSTQINPTELEGWDGNLDELINSPDITPNTVLELKELRASQTFDTDIAVILDKLKSAKRPVLFAGAGIRISGQYTNFVKLAQRLGIPVVSGWNAHDVVPNSNPYYAGRPGTVGDRAGNFTVQNADLLIVLGSRLNIRQVSYNHKNFAHRAFKIQVDADRAELDKPTLHTDLKIHGDLKEFIPALLTALEGYATPAQHTEYLNWCKERVQRYPTVLEEYKHTDTHVNPYAFVSELIKHLKEDDIVVTGNGSACVISFQTAVLKEGQRLYTNSGDASMGYDLPAAIGACIAQGGKRIICLAGDGSIMMNLQELQTVVGYNLPVKIIVLNNDGYLSIKQTQHNYFSDNVFGTCPADGVTIPNFVNVARAFGMDAYRVETIDHWRSDTVQGSLDHSRPALIEVMCDPATIFAPKLVAKKLADGSMLAPSLENMSPFLSDEEMADNTLKD